MGFIYIWYDRKHKRFYIGCHWGFEDDGYICSSRWMRKSHRRRPHDFRRRIIKSGFETRDKLYAEEHRYLTMIEKRELGKRYYNLKIWNQGHWSNVPEYQQLPIKLKISKQTKEAMQREDVRTNLEHGLKQRNTRSSDLDVREKRRQSMIATMARKYPNRKIRPKFGSTEYKNQMSISLKKAYAEGRKKPIKAK